MSEAVEGAELMLYGVSEKYKERCALLALLVHQVMLLCSRLLCVVEGLFYGELSKWLLTVDQMLCRSANCQLELNYGMQEEVGASTTKANVLCNIVFDRLIMRVPQHWLCVSHMVTDGCAHASVQT